ncbi:MAG TPA: hypothetical protein VJQ82_00850 [Terriglobales bacterium]|nr:hypothetical protein [Terriglobales bacterium]
MRISFDEWIKWVFDHPVTSPEWYWQGGLRTVDNPAGQVVEFLGRLFEDPGRSTEEYSDEQLNQGLWFIADSSCSEHISALLDEGVVLELRERCIRSMGALFEKLFAKRCSPHMASLNQIGVRPLNATCYMWWDLLASATAPEDGHRLLDQTVCLEVMQNILSLSNIACQESALHGLGHWQRNFQRETRQIVEEFLLKNPQVSGELRNYALKAVMGQVE